MNVFAFLGDIPLGEQALTGPTALSEDLSAELVQHDVAYGKKPVEDRGDNNTTRRIEFFFDESFCDVYAEFSKIKAAFSNRIPLPFVPGDGGYSGGRFLIQSLSVTPLKTRPGGAPTRYKIAVELVEVPMPDPLAFLQSIALGTAAGLIRSGIDAVRSVKTIGTAAELIRRVL